MFRRFLLHKAIGDKDLLLILPKPPLCPRLLLGTFVGNVKVGCLSYLFLIFLGGIAGIFSWNKDEVRKETDRADRAEAEAKEANARNNAIAALKAIPSNGKWAR